MWFIGVEVEQETSAPPPKKDPGSAPDYYFISLWYERNDFLLDNVHATNLERFT